MPESPAHPAQSAPLRILAWPAYSHAAHNPYQKLLYDALADLPGCEVREFSASAPFRGPGYDILHLHWPDAFLAADVGVKFWLRLLYLRMMALAVRLRGAKLIWTVHNLRRASQRNAVWLQRWFWPWFLRRVDGVIYMTEASAAGARDSEAGLATKPATIQRHGHYKPVLPSGPAEAPPALESAPPEAIFFGSVTVYKNVHLLLERFLELPKGTARLHICGKFSAREPDLLLEQGLDALSPAEADEVRVSNRFLSDADLADAVRAADLAVFPYSDVLNSGAAIFALSVGRPILASDTALFRELQGLVGAQWVHLIDKDGLDSAQLAAALKTARALRATGATPDLSAFDWHHIAAGTLAFYRDVAGRGSGTHTGTHTGSSAS